MKNKLKRSVKILTITVIVSVILFLVSYESGYGSNDLDLWGLVFHGLKIIFIINCLVILIELKLKRFILGCIIVAVALIWNYLSLVIDFSLNPQLFEVLNFILFNIFSFIGVTIFIFAIWQAFKRSSNLNERLKSLAFYDSLTNLPNRNIISNSCPIKIGITCVNEHNCKDRKHLLKNNINYAIIFVDIDDFKYINDNLGHFYGDVLLEQIATRLKTITSSEDIIIRLSGDEFLIIMEDSKENLEKLLMNILIVTRHSFKLINKEVYITCSLGVAYYPKHGETFEEVIQKSEVAMNEAKKLGKNSYFIYNDEIDIISKNRFILLNDLKTSIKNRDFIVYYQIKANTTTSVATGFEALVRWNHPTKGLVFPNDFIPIAEETGIIKEIDILVLKMVCEQIEKWTEEGKKPFNISVNISPVFFNDPKFIDTLDNIISQYKIDPSFISIEITENVALNDVELTKNKLRKLKSRNIRVYLDDFGKGYSSLTYIKNFPIDYLKIDKVFIDGLLINKVDHILIDTIINLSNYLGFKVVAEGVETEGQLELLRKMGCHEFQGYVLGRPQPISNINI